MKYIAMIILILVSLAGCDQQRPNIPDVKAKYVEVVQP